MHSDPSAATPAQTLALRMKHAIEQADGWMPFDRFMHMALYEPGLGYYVSGSRQFGAQGDFITAPELSPLFGACVARQLGQWLEHTEPHVLEFGAGTGQLAAQILNALQRDHAMDVRYSILEVSGELRERQRQTLQALAPQALDRVQWLDALPTAFDGVMLGNEVLDAMPVRLVRFDGRHLVERGVSWSDEEGLVWANRPLGFASIDQLRHMLARIGWGEPNQWPAHYIFELPDVMSAWVNTVAQHLHRGALLLIDYGFPAAEFYHPQRAEGTLMCHSRHRSHANPLHAPGTQDITAHVNFTAVAELGLAAGLDLLGFSSQANFLLNCGLIEQLATMAQASGSVQTTPYLRQAQAVQMMVNETEMGELFKAIALGRGIADAALGFQRGDRTHSLGLD